MKSLKLFHLNHWRHGAAAFVMLLGGCAAPADWPRTGREISSATGLPRPIEFRRIGGPVDEPGASPTALTLASAVEMALRTHPELQSALARVEEATADARQSRLLPNPVLSIAFRFPEGGGPVGIDASLSADIVALLQRSGRVSAADARLRAASERAVTTALDVALEVQECYIAAAALDELMPVLSAQRELLGRLVALSRSRLAAGEGTQLDVTTLESQQVELELRITEKRVESRQGRLSLARLIGRPSDEARWTLAPIAAPTPGPGDESDWIAAALAHRPEIAAVKWELAALGGDLEAARLAGVEGTEAGIDAERDGEWSAGPTVSAPLPIFDWGQARRQKLRASRIEAMHQLTLKRRQAVEETRRAHAGYRMLAEALSLARGRLIPLMRARLEQAESQYRAGQADLTALVLAERELQEATSRRIELEQRVLTALVRLRRAAGGSAVIPVAEATPGSIDGPASHDQNP